MKYFFPIILILFFLLKNERDLKHTSSFHPSVEVLDNSPEFFVLEWKEGTKLVPKKTNSFIEVDSMGKQEVVVLINEEQHPALYASEISTPVCADGECKLMNIKLYWTLLGEYAGFDRYSELPLTKHDHDEFKVEDYQKLHELLIDDKSILGRRSIDRLVEKPKMRTVNGVDAIAGATIARVKESVVSGALYSCYTAWKLVHGDIREQLKAHSLSVLNKNMIVDMLFSNNEDYHLFALAELTNAQYVEYYEQIAEVFRESTPLVRSIIAKSLNGKFTNTPDLQKPFWEAFDTIDVGSKSTLIHYLDEAPSYVSALLSTKLNTMSKNQLKGFLEHLSEKETIGPEVQDNLKEFANSESETYAYLASLFLEDREH